MGANTMIFLNLPVSDLRRSVDFYAALGWPVNETGDDRAACVVVGNGICVMLLTHDWYDALVRRPRADTTTSSAATYALALADAEEVDAVLDAAVRAGATEQVNPGKRASEAEVGMYCRAFLDPDGHQWEPFSLGWTGNSSGRPNSGNSRAVSRK
jgi:predicted lactoylglutathione lyase